MRIVLKHSQTGLYYGGDQKWSADATYALELDSCKAAVALALEKQLEAVDVVLRYEDPICELKLPLVACGPNGGGAVTDDGNRACPPRGRP